MYTQLIKPILLLHYSNAAEIYNLFYLTEYAYFHF